MASSEHLELATLIKKTHQNLRNNAKTLGAAAAWNEHCADKDGLRSYATAMKELATKHWEDSCNKTENATDSRIQWTYDFCIFYFDDEIIRQRYREIEIAKKLDLLSLPFIDYEPKKLKVLDVGSCYNPFKVFNRFDVLAVDLEPASEDVYQCDFLNLVVNNSNEYVHKKNAICSIPENTFDVIIFSLLLEYLPCPDQRLQCCINAYKLLKHEGLLIIITPDSKHVGANAKFMKSWRNTLALLGFSRIKYSKLRYIHCMAFRKSLNIKISQRWSQLHNKSDFYKKMYIPQDLNNANAIITELFNNIEEDIRDRLLLLNELPFT